jgi:hypothetical protein
MRCGTCCLLATGPPSPWPTSPAPRASAGRPSTTSSAPGRADRLVDAVHAALEANVGNIYESFLQGFRTFFTETASDPLVVSLLTGVAKPDLLQLITTDSAPIINRSSARLATAFTQTWVATSDDDADVLARAIVRLCLSYVSMPPEANHDVAADLARLMSPFAERHGVGINVA